MEDLEQPKLVDESLIKEEKEEDNLIKNSEGSKNEFGKFKDVESLLKAYNNLESEFTKKSQKLKSLESETSRIIGEQSLKDELEGKVDEFVIKYDFAKPFRNNLKESLIKNQDLNLESEVLKLISDNYKSADDYIKDEDFLTNYIYQNQSIKEKIIKDYMANITQNSPIKVESRASMIPLTPPKSPGTINEAGRLARTIIKQK